MDARRTEAVHENGRGIDRRPAAEAALLLADAQVEAAMAVRAAAPAIAEAAALVAATLSSGGRLVYAAAGSSGLMALADGLELPGTYQIPQDRVVVLIAGGFGILSDLAGPPEDDAAAAKADIAEAGVTAADCVVALSASGSTPYALGALRAAKARGAKVVALANNPGAPLLAEADLPILLATPPEMVAGSTRMGAGTAQKIALNMMSTLAAIALGHVHDGYMVNVRADNVKLRDRAARMVAAIGGGGRDEAAALLQRSGNSVKAAVLMAAGASDAAAAKALLDASGQKLRGALERLTGNAAGPAGG